nr:reverse transcriptase domain-containing protein [Tanacetum cinerariifolium]
MTSVEFKSLFVEEFCPCSEMEKLESEFWNTMVGANHAGSSEKRKEVEETSKQGGSWKDNKRAKVGKGFMAKTPPRNENASVKQVAPVSAVTMGNNQRVCYECGSSEHLCNTCAKLNRALGQVGNCLSLEGNRNTQNNRNQAR